MTERERTEIDLEIYRVYAGILFANQTFSAGDDTRIRYDFTCKEWEELLRKYSLKQIAGRGSDFTRALRLCRYFAPRLKHKGDYNGNVPHNALALLDYAFEKEKGINCVCKAKILQECCLALGIYARRLGMYPLSPYDTDNHVACEIYDRKSGKWIFLDPTTGGYFSDGDQPLGALEARDKMAHLEPVSVIFNRQNPERIKHLQTKNSADNSYYAKNMAFFSLDEVSAFGDEGDVLWLIPEGFHAEDRFYVNTQYRIRMCRESNELQYIKTLEARLKNFKHKKMNRVSLAAIVAPPDGKGNKTMNKTEE